MTYTDTRDRATAVSFRTAVMNGLCPQTGGLYVPTQIPTLPKPLLQRNPEPSFRETAFEAARLFTGDEISEGELESLVQDCYPFTAKVVPVDPATYILELFHGPTCAFKDFGARFMARVMSLFNRTEDRKLHILVATSGDTGSAVGSAFLGVEGIDVTILYPEGKVSHLQEKQLSTFTGNVRSLKIAGTFDDCQRLVKTAFTDKDLRGKLRLSSANSINISRLLPQAFYYIHSSLVVKNRLPYDGKSADAAVIACVPSGNFGNLTSGLIARAMGAPIAGFVAAVNANRTFPEWLSTGEYKPRPSIATLSNAMDVGAPSNFERINSMWGLELSRKILASYWTDDAGTLEGIKDCKHKTGYIIDPHGAVAWQAWSAIRSGAMADLVSGKTPDAARPALAVSVPEWAGAAAKGQVAAIVLETAHPAKFSDTVYKACGREPSMPERLEKALSLPDNAIPLSKDYPVFKEWLSSTLEA